VDQQPGQSARQRRELLRLAGSRQLPSGTEGWATWKLGSATVRVTFSCPLHGSNDQSITCDSSDFVVNASGTGGDVNYLKFTVKTKK
jgi:hypothetical protein